MKKLITYFSVLFLCASFMYAQVWVSPHGVSPREAEEDTTDILEVGYSALLNVGVGTIQYFGGESETALVSPTWTILEKPTASTLTGMDTVVVVDTNVSGARFITDVPGKYVIEFADGGFADTLVVWAGLYKGIEDGGCATCHANKVSEWEATGHASMLVRGLNGTLSDHYAGYCIGCHTTGYIPGADNDGFDDRTFTFPDSLYVGQYDSMLVKYPDAMKLANIQCESCHGPKQEFPDHIEAMDVSLDSKVCAVCHDEGTHHYFPSQLELSNHGNPMYAGYAGGRASCAQCHSGSGFLAYLDNGMQTLDEAPPVMEWTCAVCHDPHDVTNLHQLRTLDDVELGDGTMIEAGGTGKLCMNCHKSRRDAMAYTGPDFHPSSHYGPHHGPQADMLAGVNVPTFGMKLPSSPHLMATEDACVTCHMGPGTVPEGGEFPNVGEHTFNVVDPDGNDNVQICEGCHGNVGETFAEKKYYFNGIADHDGDGVEEGLQEEVEGLLEELAMKLYPFDSLAVDMGDDAYPYTDIEAKAGYNYFFVEEDRSKGVHNPAFAVSLLKVTLKAIEIQGYGPGDLFSVMDVPGDQGNQVRVEWTKFAMDGFGDNPITQYGVWRVEPAPPVGKSNHKVFEGRDKVTGNLEIGDMIKDADKVLTYVGYVPAAQIMSYSAVVPTVFNTVPGDTAWTEFVVSGHFRSGDMTEWTNPMAGFSVDNLIPAPPANVAGNFTGSSIDLTWDDPVDADFDYFAVFRSETKGFDPANETPIGTTSDVKFTDTDITPGKTYYYRLAAYDFNTNRSDFSDEVPVVVTGVEFESGIPTEFVLDQNYPNPFNPTTTIRYGIPKEADVHITIYNALGKEVKELVSKYQDAGFYRATWNASDNAGMKVPSGIYFYRIEAGDFVTSKKMILLK